jgi:hypothetical protein
VWAENVQNTWILCMMLPLKSKSLTSGGYTYSPVPELRTFVFSCCRTLTVCLSVIRLIETHRGLARYLSYVSTSFRVLRLQTVSETSDTNSKLTRLVSQCTLGILLIDWFVKFYCLFNGGQQINVWNRLVESMKDEFEGIWMEAVVACF